MRKKTALLILALTGFILYPGVEIKAQISAESKKTSSVSASAPVRELCSLLNDFTTELEAGDLSALQKLQDKFQEFDQMKVNDHVLTLADKELLKKTLSRLLNAGVRLTMKNQGVNYDTLSSDQQKMVDEKVAEGLTIIYEAIDKSQTLSEAGEVLNSVTM